MGHVWELPLGTPTGNSRKATPPSLPTACSKKKKKKNSWRNKYEPLTTILCLETLWGHANISNLKNNHLKWNGNLEDPWWPGREWLWVEKPRRHRDQLKDDSCLLEKIFLWPEKACGRGRKRGNRFNVVRLWMNGILRQTGRKADEQASGFWPLLDGGSASHRGWACRRWRDCQGFWWLSHWRYLGRWGEKNILFISFYFFKCKMWIFPSFPFQPISSWIPKP